MTLRPDLEMYETDGNLEPIRHPEAQHMLAAMDEHREQQEKLMTLWRAAITYWDVIGLAAKTREGDALAEAIIALGQPPDEAPPQA